MYVCEINLVLSNILLCIISSCFKDSDILHVSIYTLAYLDSLGHLMYNLEIETRTDIIVIDS